MRGLSLSYGSRLTCYKCDTRASFICGLVISRMTTIHCDAVLFDMDGVLIDSTPIVTRVWSRFALKHGLDPTDVVSRAHGRPSIETVREYFPNSDYAQMGRELERQEIEDVAGIVALPGSSELLSKIPLTRWTVVTSATRELASVRLRAAGLHIPAQIVTANDIANGKPHPEPYLKAATALGFPPAKCVVVEDVPTGVLAGKAAGAGVIGLTTTVGRLELIGAGANWVVRNCDDIALVDANAELTLELADQA